MSGKVYLIGIGPGNPEEMTPRAVKAIQGVNVVIGTQKCLDLIRHLTAGKELIDTDASPVERSEVASRKALAGLDTAIVTTGDPGTYAIAGTFFSYLKSHGENLEVIVVPGITAAGAASALLGSPMGYDFAVISLADQSSPWEAIRERFISAANSGFVLVIYNPKGKLGDVRFKEVAAVLQGIRLPSVPVGIVTHIDGMEQKATIIDVDSLLDYEIDNQSIIIIGNDKTFVFDGRMVTPRDYVKGIGY